MYWISKTHVRIEPNEMTREEALEMIVELLRELGPPPTTERRFYAKWTPERDQQVRELREAGVPFKQIAETIFGDPSRYVAVHNRARRLGVPVDPIARKRGLARQAARRIA